MRTLDDGDYRALASFRFQLRKFFAFSEASARDVGLEPRHHQLLLALRGLPEGTEASVQALAEQLVLKHNTVVELLDRLETAKLVRRERAADDRRRVRIVVTARGANLLLQLSQVHLDELKTFAPKLVGSLDALLRTTHRRAS